MTSNLKEIARRAPGFANAYHQFRTVMSLVGQRYSDPRRGMDDAHVRSEWDFSHPLEQERYRRILDALRRHLRSDTWGNALEIGCSEGLFTLELAKHCRSVTAWDISAVACARATARCAGVGNVRVEQRDVAAEAPSGSYDLIFDMDCSDYVHGSTRFISLAKTLITALEPNGYFVYCGWRLPVGMRDSWWSRWLLEGADRRIGAFVDHTGLKLVCAEPYPAEGEGLPGYTNQLFAIFRKEGTFSVRDTEST